MVHTPNALMCGVDCKHTPRRLRMVCTLFVMYQNLAVFEQTQRELGALEGAKRCIFNTLKCMHSALEHRCNILERMHGDFLRMH